MSMRNLRELRLPALPALPARWRRPLAAALLACAAMTAVNLIVADGETVEVLVAATELPPGKELTASDLSTAAYPASLVPAGAVESADEALGRLLAAPLAAGAPLTRSGLLGSAAIGETGDHVLMPVRFPDAQASSLLQPGSQIRIFATPIDTLDGGAELLLDRATVSYVSTDDGGPLAAGAGAGSAVVTVMVSAEEASLLAGASGASLSFALLGDGASTGP